MKSSDRRMRAGLAVLVGLVLALSLIGSGAAAHAKKAPPVAIPGTSVADLRLKTHQRIVQLLVPYFGLEHIAAARGFFQKYNLTVSFVNTLQGTAALPAIVSGQAQVLQGYTASSELTALNAGFPLMGVVAGAVNSKNFDTVRFLVRSTSAGGTINSAADLIGKTVGMPATAGYYPFILKTWLAKNGVDPTKVNLLAVPPLSEAAALVNGQIDAAALSDVWYTNAMAGPDGWKYKMLFADKDAIPTTRQFVVTYPMLASYVQANPDIVRAYVAAMHDAWDFVIHNKIEAKQVISIVTGVDAKYIPVPTYPKDLCIDMTAAAAFIPLAEAQGIVKPGTVTSASQFVTNAYNPWCKGK